MFPEDLVKLKTNITLAACVRALENAEKELEDFSDTPDYLLRVITRFRHFQNLKNYYKDKVAYHHERLGCHERITDFSEDHYGFGAKTKFTIQCIYCKKTRVVLT